MAAAQIPRGPVHITETVEDRAFDSVLGVCLKGHLLVAVVFRRGVEQAEHAAVNEIIQINVHGQVLVYSYCDRTNQREMPPDKAVAAAYGFVL